MTIHPAFREGNVAVITGGADGIGLAAAMRYMALGMKVCIVDNDIDKLNLASEVLGDVLAVVTDVTQLDQMLALKEKVLDTYGQVNVLMNNAGIVLPNDSWTELDAWKRVLDVNLNGVLHGVHCFVDCMLETGEPGLIINTSSKQGITSPPGNPAYNTSKAAVKIITEQLQHSLRNTPKCQLSAHLLVPGFTYTGMIRKFIPNKPDIAWVPDQVIGFMMERISEDDFYIICPDNDVTREVDNKRMEWAVGDIVKNRPALSRWVPEYDAEFKQFMKDEG